MPIRFGDAIDCAEAAARRLRTRPSAPPQPKWEWGQSDGDLWSFEGGPDYTPSNLKYQSRMGMPKK